MSARGFRAQARWQAGWCAKLGSPFTALVCTLLAERLPADGPLGRLLDRWPGDAFADVLALRIAGGLHWMVRAGHAPALATLYPPAPLPEADRLWEAMAPVLELAEMQELALQAPQTNEVMRSAVLAPGMLVVQASTGLPLRLFELGASGGLNLHPDRFRIEAGGAVICDPGSRVVLAPDWRGPPPAGTLRILGRAGVDLHPLDVTDDAIRARLLAYVWPDQPARLARMDAAIRVAAAPGVRIAAGDAADFVEREVVLAEGSVALVFHSIAFQYFGAATQARIVARLEELGARATAAAALAWLRFEADDPAAAALPTLRLRTWPGGADRLLARAHPHGNFVEWLA